MGEAARVAVRTEDAALKTETAWSSKRLYLCIKLFGDAVQ